MEVSALKYSGGIGLHGRFPLLRLQSDERLITYLRNGNMAAFEVLVSRYESRLLAFCRHLLGSREDAEDVMQEVMTAAFNAILADDRPINVRPWLYRIARNRSLNHLRRIQTIGVDSMDLHFSDNGASTADKVHEREEFRLLVGDIHELPETQKTALVLREMDALSYEQIAEAMETTVPSVKSLLVRARVSLAEAAEARLLSCEEVRIELGEIAEGLRRRPSTLVRRHLRACERCTVFRGQLRETNKALAALMPIGPLVVLKKLALFHLGHSASAGSSATAAGTSAAGGAGAGGAGAAGAGAAGAGASGAGAAGAGAAAGGTALAGSGVAAGSSGLVSAGVGALATKAAAGLAAAALVTAGAVEANHSTSRVHHRATMASVQHSQAPAQQAALSPVAAQPEPQSSSPPPATPAHPGSKHKAAVATMRGKDKRPAAKADKAAAAAQPKTVPASTTNTTTAPTTTPAPTTPVNAQTPAAGRDQTQQAPSVMPPTGTATPTSSESPPTTSAPASPTPLSGATTPTTTSPMTTTPTTTTPTTTPTTTTPTTTTPTTTPTTTTPTTTTPTTTTPTGTTPTTSTPTTTTPTPKPPDPTSPPPKMTSPSITSPTRTPASRAPLRSSPRFNTRMLGLRRAGEHHRRDLLGRLG
jgi:RNA polymerase sigma factor (sigma-70 family)